MQALIAAFIAAGCVAGIWAGVAFISGQLLPEVLGAVYRAVPNEFYRMLLILLPVYGVGNWLLGFAFQMHPIAAGLGSVAMAACAPLAIAIFASGLKINIEIATAAAVIFAACLWLHFAAQRALPPM